MEIQIVVIGADSIMESRRRHEEVIAGLPKLAYQDHSLKAKRSYSNAMGGKTPTV